jgi:hypothetical protein
VSRDDSIDLGYCRSIPASATKDVLICQMEFAGPTGRYGTGEVDTNLYVVDFTRQPPDNWFLTLKDTVSAGGKCLAWASVDSLDFKDGSLHVRVEYGRRRLSDDEPENQSRNRAMQARGSPAGFPHQLYDLQFNLGPEGFSPAESAKEDFAYVTAPWGGKADQDCSPGVTSR